MVAAAAQCQAFVAGGVATRPARTQRVVKVACMQQGAEKAPAAPLRFLAAGLAAAAVAVAPAAEAGVVLVQPEVKNFVNDTAPAPKAKAEKKEAAPKAKAEKKAAAEESGDSGIGFEAFRPLVLPVSVLAIAGAGVAATKADPEFARLLDESWGAKNSAAIGAGYETAPGLKDTPFFGGSNTSGVAPKKAAAKKAGTGTTSKKAGTGTTSKKAGTTSVKLPKLF